LALDSWDELPGRKFTGFPSIAHVADVPCEVAFYRKIGLWTINQGAIGHDPAVTGSSRSGARFHDSFFANSIAPARHNSFRREWYIQLFIPSRISEFIYRHASERIFEDQLASGDPIGVCVKLGRIEDYLRFLLSQPI
jgi:hypothetical protein